MAKTKAKGAEAKKTASTAQKVEAEKKLAPLPKEINVRLEKAQVLDGQADNHRLAAALQLASAKAICEKASINFKKWAETNIKGEGSSWENVRKLAGIGVSGDPAKAALALTDLRGKNKTANKKLRDKKAKQNSGAAAELGGKAPKAKSAFTLADEALSSMDEKGALSLMQSKAKKFGMRIVSEAEAKKASVVVDALVADIKVIQKAISSLPASGRVELITWLAAELGYKLQSPFETKDGEMPSFLARDTTGVQVTAAEAAPVAPTASPRRVRRGAKA